MADVSQYIGFDVRFDLTGVLPVLRLTDTGTYPSPANTARSGYFTITTPDQITRTFNPLIPDTTATTLTFNYTLPPATDGKVQLGDYKIIFTLIVAGLSDTTKTHIFKLSVKEIVPVISNSLNSNTPTFKVEDKTDYTQIGFGTPTIFRLWTGNSGRGDFSATTTIFDLVQAGNYYDSVYSVALNSNVIYQHSTLTWLSVADNYTATDKIDQPLFPSLSDMIGWVKNYKADHKCKCGDKNDFGYVAGLLQFIEMLGCNKDYTCIEVYISELYSLTHKNAVYKTKHTNAVIIPGANNLCNCGCDDKPCGAAATALSFDMITATSARVNYTAPVNQIYDLIIFPPNGNGLTYLNVTNGQIINLLQGNTVYIGKLTTRCTTGSPFSITSNSFTTLTALSPLTISVQPTDQNVTAGNTATFSVTATGGTTPYTYQWYRVGTGGAGNSQVIGATSSTYTTGTLSTADNGKQFYPVVYDSAGGFVVGNIVTLTVTATSSLSYRIGYVPNGVDPFVNSTTAPTGVTYPTAWQGTISNANDTITLLHTVAGYANIADNFIVLEIVQAVTNRGHAINKTDYPIPANEFARNAQSGNLKWIVSNQPWGLFISEDFLFTV